MIILSFLVANIGAVGLALVILSQLRVSAKLLWAAMRVLMFSQALLILVVAVRPSWLPHDVANVSGRLILQGLVLLGYPVLLTNIRKQTP